LIEGFFSKLARSVLRQIRVVSKQELRERLMAFIEDVNREPIELDPEFGTGGLIGAGAALSC
jgi:hypothetical protein